MSSTLEEAIEIAREALGRQRLLVTRDAWCGYTIVTGAACTDGSGAYRVLADSAWMKQSESLLPWNEPSGTPVVHVALDGSVTYLAVDRRDAILAALAQVELPELREASDVVRASLERVFGNAADRVLRLDIATAHGVVGQEWGVQVTRGDGQTAVNVEPDEREARANAAARQGTPVRRGVLAWERA